MIRQQLIEHLTRGIMHYDGEFAVNSRPLQSALTRSIDVASHRAEHRDQFDPRVCWTGREPSQRKAFLALKGAGKLQHVAVGIGRRISTKLLVRICRHRVKTTCHVRRLPRMLPTPVERS